MIRKGKWKYLNYSGAPCQLFDLDSDPDELHNLGTFDDATVADLDRELRRICSPSLENDRAERFINQQLGSIGLLSQRVGRGIA